ncbi:MAG TPA: hypothetical protein VKH46_03190 [Thermoanaerobaculia bacterium]|nr:hypothetical protein [Thermoanaerobaculia bacterium]
MRILSVALAMLLSAASWSRAAGLSRAAADGATVGQLMARVRALSARSVAGPRRQAIYYDTTLSAFLFQGGGSVAGKNGTFFHSDAMVANYRSADQTIAVGWLAQGVDNGNAPLQYFTIPGSTTVSLEDYVTSMLGMSGFGAVIVIGVDSQGNPDTTAELDGQSRIWTFQPGSSGKVSLGLPAVDLMDAIGDTLGYGLGLRNDSGSRTNIGIVNLDQVSHAWAIQVMGENQTTSFAVTVPAYSVIQAAVPDVDYGNLFFALKPNADGFFWSAYGVSVDNISGDSWVSHVNQP